MALRVDFTKEEKKEKTNLDDDIKLKKFSVMLKETAVYLGDRQWPLADISSVYSTKNVWSRWLGEKIETVDNYNKFILGLDGTSEVNFICVAGGDGKSQNPYVKTLVETIFPLFVVNSHRLLLTKTDPVPFNSTVKITDSFGWNKTMDGQNTTAWRADVEFYRNHSEIIDNIIPKLGTNAQMYSLFWNLFLTAIDDEIYNSQLSRVIDLAFMFHFDEHMIRDWCRAVEYVLNGNRLSENCDLHCDTIEGSWFFLRDEKCLENIRDTMKTGGE